MSTKKICPIVHDISETVPNRLKLVLLTDIGSRIRAMNHVRAVI